MESISREFNFRQGLTTTISLQGTSKQINVSNPANNWTSVAPAGSAPSTSNHHVRNAHIPTLPGLGSSTFRRHVAFRKRPPVYKNWKRIGVFDSAKDAEETQMKFEGCNWARRQRREVKDGLNIYYRCKESPICPVFLYLRYHNATSQVHLYRTQTEHDHNHTRREHRSSKSRFQLTNGHRPSRQDMERLCYSNWKRSSRSIEQELREKYGFVEVNVEELKRILRRVRHEFGDEGWNSDNDQIQGLAAAASSSSSSTNSFQQQAYEYPQQFVDPVLDDVIDDDEVMIIPNEEQSNRLETVRNNPIEIESRITATASSSSGVILEQEDEQETEIRHHSIVQDSNQSGNIILLKTDETFDGIPKITNVSSISSSSDQKQDNNNSCGVASTSSKSVTMKPKFTCRDETKEDGEKCLADEKSIKAAVLRYIDENYSNRDILHIREELRTLRKEKKYAAMNRLVSFTAGFLQDAFLGHHLDETDT